MIKTIPFPNNFIDELTNHLVTMHKSGVALNRVMIVFGGKRPALFVKRALAIRLGSAFVSPQFVTIDELIKLIVRQHDDFTPAIELEHCYALYNITRRYIPELLDKQHHGFAQFMPWARELLSFIDQLDLDMIDSNQLKHVQAAAHIGYDVPDNINTLLKQIILLRTKYHKYVMKHKSYPRGFQYYRAAQLVDKVSFDQIDQVIFPNFFYFHQSEEQVVKHLRDIGQAQLIFQGDQRRWPVLDRMAKRFDVDIKEGAVIKERQFDLKLYAGNTIHAQVGAVREILKTLPDHERAVVVLPEADLIMPLLSEVAGLIKEFNISMGYPLKRSSLYHLLELIFQAQRSRKKGLFYARDYLRLLRHPFIVQCTIGVSVEVTQAFVSLINRSLTGEFSSSLTGQLFINPADIVVDDNFMAELMQQCPDISRDHLVDHIERLHDMLLMQWTQVDSINQFAEILKVFLTFLSTNNSISHYPLNLKIINRLFSFIDELAKLSFKDEVFDQDELFQIIDGRMNNEIVAFVGSPLKGLQILGLFETRSLNFDHVIVLDVNEGVLPRLTINEPLIPRDVMISMGLNRIELEEEIQRYQFMRLISAAKHVHLIYRQGRDAQRSRFVEELVWEQDQLAKKINSVPIIQAQFQLKAHPREGRINKTPQIIEHLKKMTYSASSINAYLRDPMAFYYQYVLGVRERDDMLNEPENREVGNFLHQLLEDVFSPCVQKGVRIDDAFRQQAMNMVHERIEYVFGRGRGGDAYLMKSVLLSRLNRFFDQEEKRFEQEIEHVLYIEKRFEDIISLDVGDVKFTYRVDRVDQLKDGTILILDYKAGSLDPMPKALDHVIQGGLDRLSLYENVKSFQMPLYVQYLHKHFPDVPVNAAFYNLRTLDLKYFIDHSGQATRQQTIDGFMGVLNGVIDELWDIDKPFEN